MSDGIFHISTRCPEGTTGGLTNIARDDLDRIVSFDFDVACIQGEERLMGSVFDVEWSEADQVVSFQATINEESCSFP